MEAELPRIVHPLKPLWTPDAKILILGSFPSVKTREAAFFYGHPQNRFWPLMSALLGIDPPLRATEPDRARAILNARHIAMWDTIFACRVKGSADASIREVEPTDLLTLVRGSGIRHIFCNGGTSYKYYQQYQGKEIDLPVTKLPSTSPANAAWTLPRLLEAWKVILDYL